jgi:hypothetical protein
LPSSYSASVLAADGYGKPVPSAPNCAPSHVATERELIPNVAAPAATYMRLGALGDGTLKSSCTSPWIDGLAASQLAPFQRISLFVDAPTDCRPAA